MICGTWLVTGAARHTKVDKSKKKKASGSFKNHHCSQQWEGRLSIYHTVLMTADYHAAVVCSTVV